MSLTILLVFVICALVVASPGDLLTATVRQNNLIGIDCEANEQCAGFNDNTVACVQTTGNSVELCRGDQTPCRCYPALLKSCEDQEGKKCLKSCEEDDECDNDDAQCIQFDPDDGDSKNCLITCSDSSTCRDQETCAKFEDDNLDVAVCIANDVVDKNNLEEVVCVDAEALQHLSREELVYDTHRRSKVICDVNGSCATRGHMVRFQGKAMMMKSYCALVGGCVQKVAWVNSPRYRVGLVVNSKTEGLLYTAFAARYETRVEETLLSTAVHVGL